MIDYTKEQLCLIWLDSFLGLEYKHKARILELSGNCNSINDMLDICKEYIISEVGENEYHTLKTSANKEYLQFILREYQQKCVKIITIGSQEYPSQFENISCPPLVIYCKGNIELLSEELFAIVGSRKSLPLSLNLAKDYTEKLMEAGFIPVTGIAEGVDGKVISAALENGGKVISVIAGGFDNVYPKSHTDLFNKVCENGLAISEYPPQIAPKPYHFPVRNRLIAGLAKGVLIVSGGIKSGTNYTAEYAEEFGRDLFAIPYSVGVASGAGCNELIKKGALLTDTPKDILEYYGKATQNTQTENLTDAEKDIIKRLSAGEMHVEKLCAELGKRVFEITPILSVLEIKGLIVRSGNVYGLSRNGLEE